MNPYLGRISDDEDALNQSGKHQGRTLQPISRNARINHRVMIRNLNRPKS